MAIGFTLPLAGGGVGQTLGFAIGNWGGSQVPFLNGWPA